MEKVREGGREGGRGRGGERGREGGREGEGGGDRGRLREGEGGRLAVIFPIRGIYTYPLVWFFKSRREVSSGSP